MAESSGLTGFLGKSTAGLPNWAWGAVIVAGIAAAYFLPKLFGGGKSTSGTPTTGQDMSGIGLAIDPTTGLPYAVEGLVPSGNVPSGTPVPQPAPGPPGPTGPPGTPPPTSWIGKIPLSSLVWEGGVNNPGQPGSTQRWWFTAPGGRQTEFDVPIGTKIWQGGQGRWWIQLPGGQQTLLTAPPGSIAAKPQVAHIQPHWPGGTIQERIV